MCTFAEHVQHIHDGLDRATRAYNQALGCWERRVLPGARRLHRLGLHSSKDMPRLDAGEERLRTPSSDVSPE